MRLLPWTLAWARLRKHSLRTIAYIIAVGLAILSLLAIQGISHSTGNSLVSYSLSKLPLADRSLTLTSDKILTSKEYNLSSTFLSEHLAELTTGSLRREVLYREMSDSHGVGFNFGGIDDVAKSIVLESGRFPRTCNPELCEVIQIGGSTNSTPQPESFGIRIVGTGILKDAELFAANILPSDGSPLLIANGIAHASSLARLKDQLGVDGWISQINLKILGRDGSDSYVSSIVAFENQLSIEHPQITLSWPQDALGAASDQTKGISDKFILLDLVVSALLIAFLILFSWRQRREHNQFREGLSRIGTPKQALSRELLIEYATPIVVGVLLAFLISFLVPVGLSLASFHVNFWQIYEGWTRYVFLILSSIALISGSAIVGERAWRRQIWISYFFGLFLLGGYLILSGSHEFQTPFITFSCTLISALIIYPLLRGASRFLRFANSPRYILFRENLSMWQGVSAILTLAGILAVAALSFDSGISQKVIAQSRDLVPLDVSIRTGPALIRPLDLGGTEEYEKFAAGSTAYAILRSGTAVRSQSNVSDTLTLIGVPPTALKYLPDHALRGLASAITPPTPVREPGIDIGNSSTLKIALANIPKEVDMLAWFRTPHGKHQSVMLSGHGDIRSLALENQVPPGSFLIAFEFRETSNYLSRRLHAISEGRVSIPTLTGIGSITQVTLDNHITPLQEDVWHQSRFPFSFDGGSLYVRPKETLGIARVIVDPTTASLSDKGLLTLTGAGENYFQARVVAIRQNFPSAGDRFVIMDLAQLQAEIGQTNLGETDPIELWISTQQADSYLRNLHLSRFQGLEVLGRSELERTLRSNPTNVGLDGSYRVALALALLLSIFMYASALPLLYRESRGVLTQLEADGVGPQQLRQILRGSLRVAVSLALFAGADIGVLISHFFISNSTPYIRIAISLVAALALSEIGSFLFTRRFFNESAMVR